MILVYRAFTLGLVLFLINQKTKTRICSNGVKLALTNYRMQDIVSYGK